MIKISFCWFNEIWLRMVNTVRIQYNHSLQIASKWKYEKLWMKMMKIILNISFRWWYYYWSKLMDIFPHLRFSSIFYISFHFSLFRRFARKFPNSIDWLAAGDSRECARDKRKQKMINNKLEQSINFHCWFNVFSLFFFLVFPTCCCCHCVSQSQCYRKFIRVKNKF